MIKSVWKFGRDIDEVAKIRACVGDKADATDEKSIQLVLENDDIPVACGSLYFDNGSYRIAHLCVLPEMQKKYVGDMLIRLLLFRGFNMGAEAIRLNAAPGTEGFFKKYGFTGENGTLMVVTPSTLIMESKCGHNCSGCANRDLCKEK